MHNQRAKVPVIRVTLSAEERAVLVRLYRRHRLDHGAQEWKARRRPAHTALRHDDNQRLLDHLAFLVPPKMRSDLLATLYDDLDKMKALGYPPRRIRWYLLWQLTMALAPCLGRLIRKNAAWGALALAGQRVWRWIGG